MGGVRVLRLQTIMLGRGGGDRRAHRLCSPLEIHNARIVATPVLSLATAIDVQGYICRKMYYLEQHML